MSVLGALGSLIKKIFQKIFAWLADVFGQLFWILLIIVLIYFAPMIAGYLASVGAPGVLVTAFEALSLATPYVVSAVTWLWEGGASLVSSAWSAYSSLSIGTQASIALGAAALIAPDETAKLVEETTSLIGGAVSTVAGAFFSSPVGIAVLAGAAWWLFGRSSGSSKQQPTNLALVGMPRDSEEGTFYGKA